MTTATLLQKVVEEVKAGRLTPAKLVETIGGNGPIDNKVWNYLFIAVCKLPTIERMNWDEYFTSLARLVARRSRYPGSRKNGCVVVDQSHVIKSTGYNSMPRTINDSIPERSAEGNRNDWFLHAERNAIDLAARLGVSLINTTFYATWLPCNSCARSIIQVGATEVVVGDPDFGLNPDWRHRMSVAVQMFDEAKITVRRCNSATDEISLIKHLLAEMDEKLGPPADKGRL